MFYQLPPVGNQIACHFQAASPQGVAGYFSSDSYFFNSGAASLAAAVLATVQQTGLKSPEVLLPAYACPELVSAILWAGARPVPVDFAVDRPWMALDEISKKLTPHTCAIIAVSLFGIPERIEEIKALLSGREIYLIEDSAQAFPEKASLEPLQSDLKIYSFGRGKPVSLLGGGAVVVESGALSERIAHLHHEAARSDSRPWLSRLKIALYNRLISPRLYWLPSRVPFIQLGATVYKPLQKIEKMGEFEMGLLAQNIERYWSRGEEIQALLMAGIAASDSKNVMDLAAVSCKEKRPRLLRYPLLAKSPAVRDKLCDKLNREGIGASRMYPAILPKIKDMVAVFDLSDEVPNAAAFSQRILTLPVHSGVTKEVVNKMLQIVV